MKDLGPDFYSITDLLSEEELLIQKTAFEFVQTEFMPLINEHYENVNNITYASKKCKKKIGNNVEIKNLEENSK